MSAQSPLGKGSHFIIETDGETPSVLLDDGRGTIRDIAWKAPDANDAEFKWLVSSAASFHNIPVRDNT